MEKLSLTILALLSLALPPIPSAWANANGVVGRSSSASSEISLTIPEHLTLRNPTFQTSLTSTSTRGAGKLHDLSIRSNIDLESPFYQITFLGSGRDGAFTLSSRTAEIANALPYSVHFREQAAKQLIPVVAGITQRARLVREQQSLDPHTFVGAQLRTEINQRTTAVIPAGDYVGTLTVILAPE